MGKKHEDICFPCECSPKRDLAEEYFNSQVDKKTCSVCSRQILSPGTLVITLWAHEKSGKSGRDGCYANLSMPTAAYPVCQQQRSKLSPRIWPFFRVTISYLVTGWLLWIPASWKGKTHTSSPNCLITSFPLMFLPSLWPASQTTGDSPWISNHMRGYFSSKTKWTIWCTAWHPSHWEAGPSSLSCKDVPARGWGATAVRFQVLPDYHVELSIN